MPKFILFVLFLYIPLLNSICANFQVPTHIDHTLPVIVQPPGTSLTMPSRRLDCSAGIPAGMPDPQSVTLVEYLLAYSRLKDRGENLGPAWLDALELIRRKPEDWFHDQPADDRDLALINAKPMSCFNLGETSFLKKMVRPNTS